MRRPIRILVAILVLCVGVLPPTETLHAQSPVCDAGAELETADLGVPGEQGVTLTDIYLDGPDERRAFRFIVSKPGAVYVYVGDQWYDLDLALYSVARNRAVACWQTLGARARSERHQARVIQLVRPDEQIIEQLEPGVYALVAAPAPGGGYIPSRGFTVRVAEGPPVCALNPQNVPHPSYPELRVRANDAWYQLGVTHNPPQPGPFDLISFNAFVSPPYSDLFDFEWEIDGRRVPDATGVTVQVPAPELAKSGPNPHRIRVTARGAREYPQPDQTHLPPTLTAECSFTVRAA